ncbi:DUF2946 family protein [Stenotrophomonas sp. PS02298]|uniref:DUF2946 family protein n=1 Tax=Stenotrophomonas sp. PS02298 TaxID=2991424 RepID=UPI00249A5678|nr:DUF2946 family protein [Stenotrophomonas sp. PS02298]
MRSLRFQSFVLVLAFAAALLMAVAPVVSRWLQSQPLPMSAMGHAAHEVAMPKPADAHAGHHDMQHMSHDAPVLAASDLKPTPPADPHAAHGEACDYCTMASRLLPWLAVILVLAPLLYRLAPESPRKTLVRASLRWPAHPPRGPPMLSR